MKWVYDSTAWVRSFRITYSITMKRRTFATGVEKGRVIIFGELIGKEQMKRCLWSESQLGAVGTLLLCMFLRRTLRDRLTALKRR